MAISATHYELLKHLQPLLPKGGTLLEIGEANWYGDLDPVSVGLTARDDPFAITKEFYQQLFAPSRVISVDFNGTPAAWRADLNKPLPPMGLFDVVINHGTAEHIFDIAQVFRSIHAACKVGGLMIHESPFTGWLDHGFYCLQPTLFYDLAAANGYEVVSVDIEEIKSRTLLPVWSRDKMTELMATGSVPDNAMLFVVLRKVSNAGFRVPMQGYYGQVLSAKAKEAWEVLR
jgi:SAM-dependent methyltransferase